VEIMDWWNRSLDEILGLIKPSWKMSPEEEEALMLKKLTSLTKKDKRKLRELLKGGNRGSY